MTRVVPATAPEAIDEAAAALRNGDIVGVPTDTVYGLAADPWHSGAVDRLFRLKGRPRNVELPLFVADVETALKLSAAVPKSGRILMDRFWPGGLTIVLPRSPDTEADLGEEDATIGLRCPDHPVVLALCRVAGPYATTSANRHGEPPLTSAAELVSSLPGVDLVLDGGTCTGRPSTVVDCTGETPRLLREGAIGWARLLEALEIPD